LCLLCSNLLIHNYRCCLATRRARWDAKLGVQKKLAFSVNLPSIVLSGGVIPAIDVVIERVYQCLYLEKDADNRTVAIRTEHTEEIAKAKHQVSQVATMPERERERTLDNSVTDIFYCPGW
jgi:hypothetical protein